ncbi:tRNA lysidine(34) synthetase TilS, partial [bacterium]|nr:tRNA lysidine(34) synthetase TilS [bacterium]MBU1615675.1 tRNA lysidine(34) synthetase TilS [bacterium]
MLSLNDKVVVALSGGPDSVALLHILRSLSNEYNLTLYAAHLNHLLRGREAEEDVSFVRELAKELKVEIRTEEADVKKEAKEKGLSLQVAARRVRYDFLKRIAGEVGASKVALGHQLDDQAETILMRLIRGTGAEGFSGIPPLRKLDDKITIIRPLIDISSQQIREYLKEGMIGFRTDSSNLCEDYLRNKVRLRLLPLVYQLNPGFRERLLRTAKLWQADDEYLLGVAEEKLSKAILKDEEEIVLDLKGLKGLRDPILSRILRMAAKQDLDKLTSSHIQAILKLIREGPSQGKVDLPCGLVVEREYERLRIVTSHQSPVTSFKYKIEIPGVTEVREAQVKIQA